MIEQLKRIFRANPIEDIYLTGFADIEEGSIEFYPDMRYIYLSLGDKFIEFQSVEQFSELQINITDSVNHKFEIDEDMMPAKACISETILIDTLANNNIEEIILYNFKSHSENNILCGAAQITLNSGQQIFIDPTFYYGIGVGGKEQKEYWKNNLEDVDTIVSYIKRI